MKPTDATIEEFQKAYFKEFGEEISKEEAYKKFLRLVNLLRVIIRPTSRKHEFDEQPDGDRLKNQTKFQPLEEE